MNVGYYVRTDLGIGKYISDNEIQFRGGKGVATYRDIIKSSPNIIDLIEVGDYVNGNKVLFITKNENTRLEVVCSDGENLLGWRSYKEKEFKSIVTKEQFESMEYKVGELDER